MLYSKEKSKLQDKLPDNKTSFSLLNFASFSNSKSPDIFPWILGLEKFNILNVPLILSPYKFAENELTSRFSSKLEYNPSNLISVISVSVIISSKLPDFIENFAFRYHPQQQKVLELIKKKSIGKTSLFYGNYSFNLNVSENNFRLKEKLGGGVVNDVAGYLICASSLIFNEKPISIFYIKCFQRWF